MDGTKGLLKKTFLPNSLKQDMKSKYKPDQIMMISNAKLEEERSGDFRRIFPSPFFTQQYKHLFDEERASDQLLYDYFFGESKKR